MAEGVCVGVGCWGWFGGVSRCFGDGIYLRHGGGFGGMVVGEQRGRVGVGECEWGLHGFNGRASRDFYCGDGR